MAWTSDRYGRLKFVYTCMFLWPITILLFVNPVNFHQIALARSSIAVAGSVGISAWQALFVDFIPRVHRGRFNAIYTVSMGIINASAIVVGGSL